MKHKFSIGKEYRIEFLDHCEDQTEPMHFFVYGKCLQAKRNSVVIGCWIYHDSNEADDNVKHYTVLRSAMIDVKEMCFGKEHEDKGTKNKKRDNWDF